MEPMERETIAIIISLFSFAASAVSALFTAWTYYRNEPTDWTLAKIAEDTWLLTNGKARPRYNVKIDPIPARVLVHPRSIAEVNKHDYVRVAIGIPMSVADEQLTVSWTTRRKGGRRRTWSRPIT